MKNFEIYLHTQFGEVQKKKDTSPFDFLVIDDTLFTSSMSLSSLPSMSSSSLPSMSSSYTPSKYYLNRNHLVGFQNAGGTCYMNSFLQCLLWTKEFVEAIRKYDVSKHNNILTMFKTLENKYSTTNSEFLLFEKDLKEIFTEVWKDNKSVTEKTQESVDEFLRFFFQKICNVNKMTKENKLDIIKNYPISANKPPQSLANEEDPIFTQKLKEHMTNNKLDVKEVLKIKEKIANLEYCSELLNLFCFSDLSTLNRTKCQEISYSLDIYNYLPLPVPVKEQKEYSVVDIMQKTMRDEVLEDKECEKCHVPFSKKIERYTLPKILVLFLKRFNDENVRIKNNNNVTYTEILDMNNFLSEFSPQKDKNNEYELYAVINHSGTLESGHYWADCKVNDTKWIRFNDTEPSPINGPEMKSKFVYLLFYKRIEDN